MIAFKIGDKILRDGFDSGIILKILKKYYLNEDYIEIYWDNHFLDIEKNLDWRDLLLVDGRTRQGLHVRDAHSYNPTIEKLNSFNKIIELF